MVADYDRISCRICRRKPPTHQIQDGILRVRSKLVSDHQGNDRTRIYGRRLDDDDNSGLSGTPIDGGASEAALNGIDLPSNGTYDIRRWLIREGNRASKALSTYRCREYWSQVLTR